MQVESIPCQSIAISVQSNIVQSKTINMVISSLQAFPKALTAKSVCDGHLTMVYLIDSF